jgi:hypothetical protein
LNIENSKPQHLIDVMVSKHDICLNIVVVNCDM